MRLTFTRSVCLCECMCQTMLCSPREAVIKNEDIYWLYLHQEKNAAVPVTPVLGPQQPSPERPSPNQKSSAEHHSTTCLPCPCKICGCVCVCDITVQQSENYVLFLRFAALFSLTPLSIFSNSIARSADAALSQGDANFLVGLPIYVISMDWSNKLLCNHYGNIMGILQ